MVTDYTAAKQVRQYRRYGFRSRANASTAARSLSRICSSGASASSASRGRSVPNSTSIQYSRSFFTQRNDPGYRDLRTSIAARPVRRGSKRLGSSMKRATPWQSSPSNRGRGAAGPAFGVKVAGENLTPGNPPRLERRRVVGADDPGCANLFERLLDAATLRDLDAFHEPERGERESGSSRAEIRGGRAPFRPVSSQSMLALPTAHRDHSQVERSEIGVRGTKQTRQLPEGHAVAGAESQPSRRTILDRAREEALRYEGRPGGFGRSRTTKRIPDRAADSIASFMVLA